MKRLFFIFCIAVLITTNVSAKLIWDGTSSPWTNGSGTATDPYLIETPQQLAYLSQQVNSGASDFSGIFFLQTEDFDLNNLAWQPIGGSEIYSIFPFSGNYNGGNKYISNFVLVSYEHFALFGWVRSGSVNNLTTQGTITMQKTNISPSPSIIYTAGIVAYGNNASITNCNNYATIPQGEYMGGIIGELYDGTISNCSNEGAVYGQTYSKVGGIVGYAFGTTITITNCSNTGTINAEQSSGGIVGEVGTTATVTNCSNTGKVSTSSSRYKASSGGIVGEKSGSNSISIIQCSNTGDIHPTATAINTKPYSGGMIGSIGYNSEAYITNCSNTGTISSSNQASQANYAYAGGIVGGTDNSSTVTITKCSNIGIIASAICTTSYAGGIIGNGQYSTCSYCYANCAISKGKGTYGMGYYTTCSNCYFVGTLSGINNKIGISSLNCTNCYFNDDNGASSNSYGTVKTKVEMRTDSFLILLNNGQDIFQMDEANINDGFPVFDWQLPNISNYTITCLCDTNQGTVTGGGEYEEGTYVQLTATPNNGYTFLQWNDDNTDNPRSVVITQDTTFTATFSQISSQAISIYQDCSRNNQSYELNDSENGHEMVDLGLSVQWATMNVGAAAPEDYGKYFAWGETTEKNDYSWITYKYCNGSEYTITKYCDNRNYGIVDNKTTLEPIDDAAYVNWGGDWRMPTKDEWNELIAQCTLTWTVLNGVNGFQVVSKINGNSIFLPAAGERDNTMLSGVNVGLRYWSSLRVDWGITSAYVAFAQSGTLQWLVGTRYRGLPVRPVCQSDSITIDYTLTLYANECDSPNTFICSTGQAVSINATPTEYGQFVEWSDGNTDNPRTIVVTQDTTLTAVFSQIPPQAIPIYQDCSQNGLKIRAQDNVDSIIENSHEMVDLGLSVQWATMNVGATAPEDYGKYFAWGETTDKNDYSWITYKYCNGSPNYMTKYCKSSTDGIMDNKITLEPEDDAAHKNWGGNWRTPTDAEWTELRTKCTWTWITHNNIKGYQVTGKNGNSIFLPATGCCIGTDPNSVGSKGRYWSSSLTESFSNYANNVDFDLNYVVSNYYVRAIGQSIRPVWTNSNYYTLTLYANECDSPNTFTCSTEQLIFINATPLEHNHFVNWNDGNAENPRTITVSQDTTFTATFALDEHIVNGETHHYGDQITLTAPDSTCHTFKWSNGATANPYIFTLIKDTIITPIYELKQYTISTSATNGTVTGAGTYNCNENIILTAGPDECYEFTQWSDGNTDNPRTITVTSNATYTAEFEKIKYKVSVSADNNSGTVDITKNK